MRRAVLTLGGTVAGLAALLTFKTHSIADAAPAASPPPVSVVTSQPAPTPTRTGAAGAGATKPGAATKPAAATPTASTSTQATVRTATGMAVSTQYGPMQVEVTLDGSKITKVTVLQQTDDGGESAAIDSAAIPKLTSETLAAQSAGIDAVSGASYTSSGYVKSLQSALDQA
jgi:uncharacterized protein with FMN-binding domain